MSKFVLKDAFISVASVDLSDHVKSVTVDLPYDEVDMTAMSDAAHNALPGIRADSIEVTFLQDFAAGSVDATLEAMNGSAAGAAIVVRPTSAVVGATNPSYSGTGLLFGYSPLAGGVGDGAEISVTFKPTAAGFTRAVA